jgi:hypothetical protein
MAGPRPVGYTGPEWAAFGRKLFEQRLEKFPAAQLKEKARWEKAIAICYNPLWPAGQAYLAQEMQTGDHFARFHAIKAKIQAEWAPAGVGQTAALHVAFLRIDDSHGMLKMFRDIQESCQQHRLTDPASVPSEADKKLQLINGVHNKFFKWQLMQNMNDLLWDYAHIERIFRLQIRTDPALDTAASITPATAANITALRAAMCRNCNLDDPAAHLSKDCTSLFCSWCNGTWPTLTTPGRHTSATCPARLAAQSARGGRGGAGGGRNGGRGGRSGRNGGRGGRGGRSGRGGRGADSGRGTQRADLIAAAAAAAAATLANTEAVTASLAAVTAQLEDMSKRMRANDI